MDFLVKYRFWLLQAELRKNVALSSLNFLQVMKSNKLGHVSVQCIFPQFVFMKMLGLRVVLVPTTL